MHRNFTFTLMNLRDNQVRSFSSRRMSMNEAIGDAFREVHSLRKDSKDRWKIISAIDDELHGTLQGQ